MTDAIAFTTIAAIHDVTPRGIQPMNVYDDVPYEGAAQKLTYPGHLCVIARLMGLDAAPIRSARVLEIGCALGANLIPMAQRHPESQFIGLDYSTKQIEIGRERARQLGLTNVTFNAVDIADVDDALGEFDYIIAHGIFSWISPALQDKLLAICSQNLADNGVALVSFNTYPGWHFRSQVRQMMMFHTAGNDDMKSRVQDSRSFMKLMAETATEHNFYRRTLEFESRYLEHSADSYVCHEFLEEQNVPMFFHQFMTMAGQHELSYLGDADPRFLTDYGLPAKAGQFLAKYAGDVVGREQHIDFFRNRMFRSTLLVKSGHSPRLPIRPEYVLDHHAWTKVQIPNEVPLRADQTVLYKLDEVNRLAVRAPLMKIAISYIREYWPNTIHFDELLDLSCKRLGAQVNDKSRNVLASELLRGFLSGVIGLSHEASNAMTEISDRPVLSDVSRAEAASGIGASITNIHHDGVTISDPAIRHMMTLLDGTRSLPDIAAAANVWLAGHQMNNRLDVGHVRKLVASLVNLGICPIE